MKDFIGGNKGQWRVLEIKTVVGEPIKEVSHVRVLEGALIKSNAGIWTLRGFSSNVRYAEKAEKEKLLAIQEGLDRPQANLRCTYSYS